MSSPDLQRAREVAPDVLTRRIRIAPPLAVLTGLGVLVAIGVDLGLSPAALFAGSGKLGTFLGSMFPPSSGGDPGRIVRALAETFAMACAGTAVAAVVALPVGIAGAKSVVGQPAAHFLLRRMMDAFRGVPALVWALIYVAAFGLGPFGGVLALATADIPSLAKLYAETIENCDEKPIDGLRAAGASPAQVLRFGLLPQAAPLMTSQTLFYLESNFRHAAVLGIVGAGGIGFELEERIRVFAFDQVSFIILLYVACVAALDTLSQRVRARLA